MLTPATLDYTQPLDNSMGAFFVGLLVSALLHGVCLIQAVQYFQKYPTDQWFIKAAVVTTISVDALHLILTSAGVYHYVIQHFHEPERLEYLTWPLLIEALLVGVNASIVQTFFIYRIWRMSKGNYILCGIIAFLIVGEVAAGLTWVILTMQMETWLQLLKTEPVAISIDVLSCTIDVLVAGSLVIMLHRARTGFKRSDTIINKLIIFVINTGILTTIFAFCALISVIAAPKAMYYAGFYFCIGRLYTNSLLATLNARNSVASSGAEDTELKASSITPRGTLASHSRNINIRIETTQEAVREGEKPVHGHSEWSREW
ncbi:hypothetical protein CPB83DRAFT_859218 [Crepidotus variabilis]|uniref:DUF6534 domain-containing protein n=1 Tax=Crepidotus variabilis TaxID=179855 RepID=A0A9P6EA41_9AGAR|nr:hypothetical protein CPB83DRAFT_859218 [Crepidotus variabilis]